MNADYIEKLICKLFKAASIETDIRNFDEALNIVSVAATILYKTNIRYVDDDLENIIKRIGEGLNLNIPDYTNIVGDTVLFWDGFGINDRGLAQIYLKALCKIKNVVYVTYEDRKDKIPDILDILENYQAKIRYINRNSESYIDMIKQLYYIVADVMPKHFFFYSVPDDVVATPLLYALDGVFARYQINLTDHAFWLGAGCCDICVNFRSYGARISAEYRNIKKENNVVIPFYPIIHNDKDFLGFPFDKKSGQKVVFSGGALYKTLSDDRKYYILVDHILKEHQETVFWYAGVGDDTELKKILNKYPDRAFHTPERSDLFQVLEKCDIYLSTYPMCGGLMFQYAAKAGLVPVTLKHSNISDDFLIDQEKIGIEFDDAEGLYKEVDRLLDDNEYFIYRSEMMKKSVISSEVFEEEVRKLVCGIDSETFKPEYEHIDTNEFRKWYISDLSKHDIDAMTVRRQNICVALKYYPFELIRGYLHVLFSRIMKRMLSI